jgi:hypothetical protein
MRYAVLVIAVFTSFLTLAMGDRAQVPTPELAKTRREAAIQGARLDYETIVRPARQQYFRSLLAADQQYLADLTASMREAMQSGDLDKANAINKLIESAKSELDLHRRIGNNVPQTPIVRATWIAMTSTGTRSFVVTDKLKEIIARGQRGIVADCSLFGDPMPGIGKILVVTVSNDGQAIQAYEGQPVPDALFPPVAPEEDLAANP